MKHIFIFTLLTLIIAAILFINFYPHFYAYKNTPPNYSYSGQASWFDPQDINNYLVTIKSTQKSGHLFLQNPNTTQTTKPTLIYPLYTIAGTLFPKTNHILLYHSLALINTILLALGIYSLTFLLTKNHYFSLVSLLLTSLGGGFGFAFPSLGLLADLSIPGVTFLSNFQKPHEGLAGLLYMSSLILFFLTATKRQKSFLILSCFALLLLIPFYPYRILSFFLITGLFSLITSSPTSYLISLATPIIPATGLYVYHFLSSGFSALTSFKPPAIPLYSIVLGYGVFFIFFLCQPLIRPKQNKPLRTFLNLWIIISLFLSIFPWGMGRLFLNGLLFPLVLSFILSIKLLSKRLNNPPAVIIAFVLLTSLPSSAYIFIKRIQETRNNNPWFYFSSSTQQALDFLATNKPGGVLTLNPYLASLIPAHTGQTIYFGIKDQTPDYLNKVNQATVFYQGRLSTAEAKSFLAKNQISYIIVQLRKLDNINYPFLTEVFQNQDIKIYHQPDLNK